MDPSVLLASSPLLCPHRSKAGASSCRSPSSVSLTSSSSSVQPRVLHAAPRRSGSRMNFHVAGFRVLLSLSLCYLDPQKHLALPHSLLPGLHFLIGFQGSLFSWLPLNWIHGLFLLFPSGARLLISLTASCGSASGLISSLCVLTPLESSCIHVLNTIFICRSSKFVAQAHLSPKRCLLRPAVHSVLPLSCPAHISNPTLCLLLSRLCCAFPIFQNENHGGLLDLSPLPPSHLGILLAHFPPFHCIRTQTTPHHSHQVLPISSLT